MSIDRPEQPRAAAVALSRRRFLLATVSGGAAVAIGSLLSACASPQPAASPTAPAKAVAAAAATAAPQAAPGGFSGGGSLKLLMRSHFVPAFDVWFDKWAADWGTKNKVEVQADHILAGSLPPKIAAEVAAGAGHDIYVLTRSADIALYSNQLLDVSDVAKQFGDKYGGVIPPGEHVALVPDLCPPLPPSFSS